MRLEFEPEAFEALQYWAGTYLISTSQARPFTCHFFPFAVSTPFIVTWAQSSKLPGNLRGKLVSVAGRRGDGTPQAQGLPAPNHGILVFGCLHRTATPLAFSGSFRLIPPTLCPPFLHQSPAGPCKSSAASRSSGAGRCRSGNSAGKPPG